MTIIIKIDSINNIPIKKINELLEYMCEDIMNLVISEEYYNNVNFNYSLNSIKSKTGFKRINLNDDLVGSECCICCTDYKVGEYKRTLNCKHDFHKKCIDKWFKKSNNCPLCREEV